MALKSTAVTVDAPEAKFKAASTASFDASAAKDNQTITYTATADATAAKLTDSTAVEPLSADGECKGIRTARRCPECRRDVSYYFAACEGHEIG